MDSATFFQKKFTLNPPCSQFVELLDQIHAHDDFLVPHVGFSPTGAPGEWTGMVCRSMQSGWLPEDAVSSTLESGLRLWLGGGFLYLQPSTHGDQEKTPAMEDRALVIERWRTDIRDAGFGFVDDDIVADPMPFILMESAQGPVQTTTWILMAYLEVLDPAKAASALVYGLGDKCRYFGMGMMFPVG